MAHAVPPPWLKGSAAFSEVRPFAYQLAHQRINALTHIGVRPCIYGRFLYGGPMKMLVLHTPKGGSGKSTLAREIATAAARSGRNTAIADLDPQGTMTGWYQRRKNEAPALVNLDPASLAASLRSLTAAGFDLLVVDTPPASPPFIPVLLTRADMVLVPVRPTPDDLLAAAAIAKNLVRHPQWAFVLSQVPPRTRLLASAVRQLAAIGRVAPVQVTFRADYPAAAIDGSAASELTGKAAQEAEALYCYINSMLEDDDGKAP